jgi:hypothetical protein
MNAPAKFVGFDGHAPSEESVRDHDGRGKREIIRTIRYDTIGRLEKQGIILPQHADAARRLQRDMELAEIASYSSPHMISGAGTNRPADAKLDAMSRLTRARERVGPMGWQMLERLIVRGETPTTIQKALRVRRGHVAGVIAYALDTLARYYGLLT